MPLVSPDQPRSLYTVMGGAIVIFHALTQPEPSEVALSL
uniref:Uncharacterized protein n=1 Tax=Anguilla anguilla TaxID=7936 RepID=A0A0E9PD48_ANGAN